MYDILYLGMKDLFKNKTMLIILVLLVMSVTIIFTSSTLSLFYMNSVKDETSFMSAYNIASISTDMSNNKDLAEDYYDFINKNGSSYFFSQSLQDTLNIPCLVLLGNGKIFNENIKNDNKTTVYAINYENNSDKIKIQGNEYELTLLNHENVKLPEQIGYLNEGPYLILHVKDKQIGKWLDYSNGIKITEIVENSSFNNNALAYQKQIEDIFKTHFIKLIPLHSQDTETRFIMFYVYPYITIVFIATLLAFSLFNNYFLNKMYIDYSIHYFYGARLVQIMLRSTILIFVSLLIIMILYTYISQGIIPYVAYLGYSIIIVMLAFIEGVIIRQMRKSEITKHLKGGL